MMNNSGIPKYNETHARFKLNGIHYPFEELSEIGYSLIKEGEPFERQIGDFLLDWSDAKTTISLKSSGTTGVPKTIVVNKQSMVNSALMTASYFNIEAGHKALMCTPAIYIAGKMMLVRAMVLGLELDIVEPVIQPDIKSDSYYDFSAMLPMQLQKSMGQIDHIKTVIVGGAPVSLNLKNQIQNVPSEIFETYGMTETLTHIAVKPLNGINKKEDFQVIPGVEISQDERNCLLIIAPKLSAIPIQTNDVVQLNSETTFEWIGRYDNVINSGGLKLHPEQIENKLASKIDCRYFIASEEDDLLGQRVILVLESKENKSATYDFSVLEKHEIPKAIYVTPKFSETKTGKINRNMTLEILN